MCFLVHDSFLWVLSPPCPVSEAGEVTGSTPSGPPSGFQQLGSPGIPGTSASAAFLLVSGHLWLGFTKQSPS